MNRAIRLDFKAEPLPPSRFFKEEAGFLCIWNNNCPFLRYIMHFNDDSMKEAILRQDDDFRLSAVGLGNGGKELAEVCD